MIIIYESNNDQSDFKEGAIKFIPQNDNEIFTLGEVFGSLIAYGMEGVVGHRDPKNQLGVFIRIPLNKRP